MAINYGFGPSSDDITLVAGDLQIGAVELKDEDSDDRAVVKTASTAADTDIALVVADPNLDAKIPALATTATLSNAAYSDSNGTLLALNAARLGATFFNDADKILYLKCGATATATSFTVEVEPSEYYELPFKYTGIVDGIWITGGSGACRVTEFTA